VRDGHPWVRVETIHHLLDAYLLIKGHGEVRGVHVLGVELDRRGVHRQVVAEGGEEMMRIAGVMRPEPSVFVGVDGRAGHKTSILADVIGSPYAQELPVLQVGGAVGVEGQGLDHGRDVVGVARHDVEVTVLFGVQGGVIDPPRVHLPETELRALGQKAPGTGHRFIQFGLVLVACGGTVDHHRGALQGLPLLILRIVSQ